MAGGNGVDVLKRGRCLCNRRTLGIVAISVIVCSLIIVVKTWSTGDPFTLTGPFTHSAPGKQDDHAYQPRRDISRESDGCSCIDRQREQILDLTSGQPLNDLDCPAARNASYFPPGQNKHLIKVTLFTAFSNATILGIVSILNSKETHISLTTALASFPASGNTWTRHLIEYISGILTGSVYSDGKLGKMFKGSKARPNQRVIAIKTHHPYSVSGKDGLKFDNVVLLIRPPNEAVASFFNYKKVGGHKGNAAPTAFNSTGWTNHVNATIPYWRNFYLSYLNKYNGRLLLLSYPKLKRDFLSELCRLGTFLNVTISYETLWCALKNREGKFHRKSNVDYNGVYTNLEMDSINSAVLDVKQAIAQRLGNDALDGLF